MRQASDKTLLNEVQQRVQAPRQVVWPLLGFDGLYLETLPVSDVKVDAAAQRATFAVRLGVGPLSIERRAWMRVGEAVELERLEIEGALENGSLVTHITARLAEVGRDQTLLTYEAVTSMPHPMRRLRRTVSMLMDDHVRTYVRLVTESAERHHRAQQSMGV